MKLLLGVFLLGEPFSSLVLKLYPFRLYICPPRSSITGFLVRVVACQTRTLIDYTSSLHQSFAPTDRMRAPAPS